MDPLTETALRVAAELEPLRADPLARALSLLARELVNDVSEQTTAIFSTAMRVAQHLDELADAAELPSPNSVTEENP